MNQFLMTTAAVSLLVTANLVNAESEANSAAGTAMSDKECSELWNKARQQSIGELKPDEARPYIADIAQADTDKNGSIDSKEWGDACKAGRVASSPMMPPDDVTTEQPR